ncbi:MAG: outer membrane protein transport protein [candidate division Zixibacteria bacterium]|nr:outer membrane protein transport protein [candidate division Zixibacteria bacterium]
MKRLWLYSCLLLLALTGLASAQVSFDFTGAGARAEGMGKAFIGVADDASALTWNPAGLVGHEKPILGLSLATSRPRGSFKYMNGNSYDFTESYNNLTYLSFLSPVRIRGHQFVLSAAYSQTFEDYEQVNFDQAANDVPHELLFGETYDYRAIIMSQHHANPYIINFGFGTPVSPALDLGASINIYSGRAVTRSQVKQMSYEYEAIDRLNQEVTRDSTQSSLDTASFSGMNFTFAGKWHRNKLALGFVVRSAHSFEALSDIKLSDTVRYNGQLKTGGTVYLDDQLIKYELPWIFGAGMGYKMTENWLLAFDAEYRGYASTKIKRRTSIRIGSGGNNEEIFEEFDPQFYNCFVFRAGTEYLWNTGKSAFPIVPLRFGLGYVPIPTPSVTIDGDREQVTQYQVSAGTGVRWSQIFLDLSYGYSTRNTNAETVFNGIVESGEINSRTHRLNLTFTGYF